MKAQQHIKTSAKPSAQQHKFELLDPSDLLVFSPAGSAESLSGGVGTPILGAAGGVSSFGHQFDFVEPGGRDHLLPGRPLEQTIAVPRPQGTGFMVAINGFTGAFVTDGGGTLTQRPLGQLTVFAGMRDFNTLVCRVRLTDENSDDAIHIIARIVVLFFP